MKKLNLSLRAAVSIILTALFFALPAFGLAMNSHSAVTVKAEDADAESSTEDTTETEESSESGTTVSDGDDTTAKPVCSCTDKCTAYEKDTDCPVCAEDYKECAYEEPNVVIRIHVDDGWYNDTTTVTVSAYDTAGTGNFEIVEMQAKIGQNGSWTDVTDSHKLSISENCTVYVQVTDQKGNTYEKNRAIKCFDTTKPTLNAAISDGLLTVQAQDTDSGVKVIYVNGYEFTDLTNGTLNIRLQQFDAGYEYFTISAMDNAGNVSDIYKTANPYYSTDEDDDESAAEDLPESAEATSPSSATATVTEHSVTDSSGNTTADTASSIAEQKKAALAEADDDESETVSSESDTGKEFYTIQTASDKVFYLVIDRDGDAETVYFLTEITENDLLNVTSDNSETLPKNSAAVESAIPTTTESALSNNNTEEAGTAEKTVATDETEEPETTEADTDTEAETEEPEQADTAEEGSPLMSYLVLGVIALIVIGGAYYFKVVCKKKEDFVEDEDDPDYDEEEILENEDESDEDESQSDDFFGDSDKEGDE